MKPKNKLFLIIVTLLFFVIIGYFYRSHIFASRFVDEEYNFAIGRYLQKGEILYDDIITNHQPVTHILSYLVQDITKPNNTYSLIKNHRLAIVIWSCIWSILLVIYFDWGALMFIVLFELTKGYIFGNLFLAESITTYPLVFFIGLTISQRKLSNLEIFIGGICLCLCGLLFGPLIPLLTFLTLVLTYGKRQHLKTYLKFLLPGMLIVLFGVLKFTSLLGYIHYYLYTNLIYTIPNYHQTYYNEPWILTISKSFLTPVLAFLRFDTTPTLNIIRILTVSLVFNLLAAKAKRLQRLLLIFIILGLTNIRFVYPGNEHFAAGFLPWYSSFIFITSIIVLRSFKTNHTLLKLFNIVIISLVLVLSIKYSQPLLFTKRDPQLDYSINYSTQTDRGKAIQIMKEDKDTLFVSLDAWLVYWQSDTNHLPKLFGYYPWMSGITDLHKTFLKSFEKSPPTFIYCDNCKGSEFEKFLVNYIEIQKDKNKTNLFVSAEKVKNLTPNQKEQLKNYNFTF